MLARDRIQALDSETKRTLNYAAAKAEVEVEVHSGGQPTQAEVNAWRKYQDTIGKGEPWIGVPPTKPVGKRVGTTTRHDHGHAADVHLYVRDDAGQRRELDFSTVEGRRRYALFVKHATEAGLTGIGAAEGYMGNQSIHAGGGNPDTTWGKERVFPSAAAKAAAKARDERMYEFAPGWLAEAYNEGKRMRDAFRLSGGVDAWEDKVRRANAKP